jgi:hypothetical protein
MNKSKVEVKLVQEFGRWPLSGCFASEVEESPRVCVFMSVKQKALVSCRADGDAFIS